MHRGGCTEQPVRQLSGRDRPRPDVPLAGMAAEAPQRLGLGRGLDALGDRLITTSLRAVPAPGPEIWSMKLLSILRMSTGRVWT